MYTVIVADDEEEIRRGIVRKVRWEELGFRVVGEAENGAEALEMVEEAESGFCLRIFVCHSCRELSWQDQCEKVLPTVQIAFLSGFDDFSYAQQAIQYNIVSYMLKPISAAELEEELRNIKAVMDRKFEEFNSKEMVQERMEKSEFLFPLLLDGYQSNPSEEEMEELRQAAVSCGLIGEGDMEMYRF